jgi:hypothetical protein
MRKFIEFVIQTAYLIIALIASISAICVIVFVVWAILTP